MQKTDEETAPPEQPTANPDTPLWKGSLSAKKPIVAPDGHVNLSQEDIDARQ